MENYKLLLQYANSENRVYDFSANLTHPFFHPLANETLFKQVKTVDGELEWPSGQDFCLHTLYYNSKSVQNEG